MSLSDDDDADNNNKNVANKPIIPTTKTNTIKAKNKR